MALDRNERQTMRHAQNFLRKLRHAFWATVLAASSLFNVFSAPLASAATKAIECKAALSASESLNKEITDLSLETLDFPEHETFVLLQKRYRKLDQDIDRLMDKIRIRLSSPVVKNTEELGDINKDILARIQKIQKVTNPGLIQQFIRNDLKAEGHFADAMHELLFCRSKGEKCLEGLNKDITELKEFHKQLQISLEGVEAETTALKDLASSMSNGNSAVLNVILRQIENLKTTKLIFENQIAAHHQLLAAALLETSTFENDFRNSIRLLFAQGDPAVVKTQRLSTVNGLNTGMYDSAVEKFPVGTKVYALSGVDHGRVYFTPVVVQHSNSKNEIVLEGKAYVSKKGSYGKVQLKNLTFSLDPRDVAIQGCHDGFCTSDELVLNGKIWAFSVHKYFDHRTPFFHQSISKDAKLMILGYNPVVDQFLVRNQSNPGLQDYHWVESATLRAIRSGSVNMLGLYDENPDSLKSEKIAVGDFVVTSKGRSGRVQSLIDLSGRVSFGHDSWESGRIAKPGCFRGFCTGKKLTVNSLSKEGKVIVIGYSAEHDSFLFDISSKTLDSSFDFHGAKLRWISRKDLVKETGVGKEND